MATELGDAGADSDADPALEDLHWAYRSGALILFVGSGLSVAAGLPSRADIAGRIKDRARERGAPAPRVAEMEALLEKQRFLDVLSIAQACLAPDEISDVIERASDDQ